MARLGKNGRQQTPCDIFNAIVLPHSLPNSRDLSMDFYFVCATTLSIHIVTDNNHYRVLLNYYYCLIIEILFSERTQKYWQTSTDYINNTPYENKRQHYTYLYNIIFVKALVFRMSCVNGRRLLHSNEYRKKIFIDPTPIYAECNQKHSEGGYKYHRRNFVECIYQCFILQLFSKNYMVAIIWNFHSTILCGFKMHSFFNYRI